MDKLKFLGVGSGFNTALGSTAAYFIEGETLFLIDCGESVYARINELKLLDGIKVVNFFCTHTHSDHIGSVGNLLLDCKYRHSIAFNLICSSEEDHYQDILAIINAMGGKGYYGIVSPESLDSVYKSFKQVRYMPAQHVKDIPAYSLVFYTEQGAVFYSGDSATMGFAEELILGGAKIKDMYFDVSSDPLNKCHLPIDVLYRLMPAEFRSRTHCMHFNDQKCINMAKSMGFNVVASE